MATDGSHHLQTRLCGWIGASGPAWLHRSSASIWVNTLFLVSLEVCPLKGGGGGEWTWVSYERLVLPNTTRVTTAFLRQNYKLCSFRKCQFCVRFSRDVAVFARHHCSILSGHLLSAIRGLLKTDTLNWRWNGQNWEFRPWLMRFTALSYILWECLEA